MLASVGPAASHTATLCLRLREYFDKNGASAGTGLIVCDFSANRYRGAVFSFQFSVFSTEKTRADSRRYTNGSTTMAKKRCTRKALAERRRRTFQLYLAEFSQEEIAEKVGVHSSVVCRDLQWIRDSICPGESPDVQEACFIQMAKNDLQSGTGAVRPQTPAVGRNVQPRGGGRILERQEDLRPEGRWVRPPTGVVNSICSLTQFNAI